MSTTLIVGIAVIVVGAAVALAIRAAQRRSQLRGQFGPEYDRTVKSGGSRRAAERELLDRRHRVEHMDIRPLAPAARNVYRNQWTQVQERFADTPADALSDADLLIRHVMADRGYEPQNYQQRVADLSIEHSTTPKHYRAAHDISARAANTTADTGASTEELRQAIVHYRTLFEDLLDAGTDDTAEPPKTDRELQNPAAADVITGTLRAPIRQAEKLALWEVRSCISESERSSSSSSSSSWSSCSAVAEPRTDRDGDLGAQRTPEDL